MSGWGCGTRGGRGGADSIERARGGAPRGDAGPTRRGGGIAVTTVGAGDFPGMSGRHRLQPRETETTGS
jgi:hypothetical protein